MTSRRVLAVFGTRPEAIKLAPVLRRLRANPEFVSRVCVTGQHRELLGGALDEAGLVPDHNLEVFSRGQTLTEITCRCLSGLGPVMAEERPDVVLVQGDTTSAFAASLAAFYQRIPIAHVEAGLRTHDLHHPFPEEGNRRMIGALAQWHFAPTARAMDHLLASGVDRSRIHVTGNTGVDALLDVYRDLEGRDETAECRRWLPDLSPNDDLVLATMHRREALGDGVRRVCSALARVADRGNTQIAFPVHPNDAVREPVHAALGAHSRVRLLPPLGYAQFVTLLRRANLVVTDSGGVQEEAVTLDVPVLVTREVTERSEGVDSAAAHLVGTDRERIVSAALEILDRRRAEPRQFVVRQTYGDGGAAQRIVDLLRPAPRSAVKAPSPPTPRAMASDRE